MSFYRITWLAFFSLGAIALAGYVVAFDSWAVQTAAPGAELLCHGTLAGNIPLTRAPLCLAVWFTETKAWLGHAQEMVLHTAYGLQGGELLHTADIGLFAFGTLAGGLALNWLWATAMTHVAIALVAACYSLVQGLSQFLRSHTA